MKANFSLTQTFVPSFNGNKDLPESAQLTATLKMPTVQDVFAILDAIQSSGVSQKADSDKLTMKQAAAIAKEAGSYIPKYVELKGNEDFSIDEVIQYPPFFALAAELLFALVQFAQPNETDVKNS